MIIAAINFIWPLLLWLCFPVAAAASFGGGGLNCGCCKTPAAFAVAVFFAASGISTAAGAAATAAITAASSGHSFELTTVHASDWEHLDTRDGDTLVKIININSSSSNSGDSNSETAAALTANLKQLRQSRAGQHLLCRENQEQTFSDERSGTTKTARPPTEIIVRQGQS